MTSTDTTAQTSAAARTSDDRQKRGKAVIHKLNGVTWILSNRVR
jgi:hypothetical protein